MVIEDCHSVVNEKVRNFAKKVQEFANRSRSLCGFVAVIAQHNERLANKHGYQTLQKQTVAFTVWQREKWQTEECRTRALLAGTFRRDLNDWHRVIHLRNICEGIYKGCNKLLQKTQFRLLVKRTDT